MKRCSKCKLKKSLDEFRLRSKGRGRQAYCLLCESAYNAAYREANYERRRAQKREKRYGISDQEFQHLLDLQGHCCAACKDPLKPLSRKRTEFVHVDHDHATDVVRGLLCQGCNLALGHVKDDVNRLRSLIQYLEVHNATS